MHSCFGTKLLNTLTARLLAQMLNIIKMIAKSLKKGDFVFGSERLELKNGDIRFWQSKC